MMDESGRKRYVRYVLFLTVEEDAALQALYPDINRYELAKQALRALIKPSQ